jgi:hypothetical protein
VVEKGPELVGFLYDRLVSETADLWFGGRIDAFFSALEIPFPGNGGTSRNAHKMRVFLLPGYMVGYRFGARPGPNLTTLRSQCEYQLAPRPGERPDRTRKRPAGTKGVYSKSTTLIDVRLAFTSGAKATFPNRRFVPVAAIAAIRRTGFMEYPASEAA